MKTSLIVLFGLAFSLLASCSPLKVEGRYTCRNSGNFNGDVFVFRDDGSVDEMRTGSGLSYVVEGDIVKIVRSGEKDAAGANIKYELRRDGDRLFNVRNENFVCEAGAGTPSAGTASPAPAADAAPAAPYVGQERAGMQPAEVMTIRLGDSVGDVRRKVAALAEPLRENSQTLISDDPVDVYKTIEFTGGGDGMTVSFSPPPQRVIAVRRTWGVGVGKPLSWPKLLEQPISRYGPASEGARGQQQWFLSAAGKPMDPPPFARECKDGFDSPQFLDVRCGRMLQYWTGTPNGPVAGFAVYLFDTKALLDAEQAWAEDGARRKARAAAQADGQLRNTALPQQ